MLADNALLIAFAEGQRLVKGEHVRECLRDMERRDRPVPLAEDLGEELRRRARWPWLLFVLLAATALVVMAYQFGITRSTLEPAPAPVEAPAEVMIEDTTPPPDESVPADSVALDAGAMALQDSLPPAEPDSLALAPADSIAPNPAEPSEDSGSIPAEALASSTYSPSLESRLELRERMRDSRMVAYRVVPGDQFNRLAERISGRRDPLFLSELRLMNPHIQDFDRILPGWILYFPKLEEKP